MNIVLMDEKYKINKKSAGNGTKPFIFTLVRWERLIRAENLLKRHSHENVMEGVLLQAQSRERDMVIGSLLQGPALIHMIQVLCAHF
jgi:hypothetical protein